MANRLQPTTAPSFIRYLGAGSFGLCYCMLDPETDKIFAAKCIPSVKEEQQEKINQLTQLDFPSLGKFKGVAKTEINEKSYVFLLREYFDNQTLENALNTSSNDFYSIELTATRKSILIFGIAAALFYLHQNKCLHVHFSPSNIIFDRNLEPKVVDYSTWDLHCNDNSQLMTISRTAYSDPNYIYTGIPSREMDVFSFALVLYSIIANQILYINPDDQWGLLSQISSGMRPSLPYELPEFYRGLIESCWNEQPNIRPTISQIMRKLTETDEFIFDGSNFDDVHSYQRRLFPNGFPEFEKCEIQSNEVENFNEQSQKHKEENELVTYIRTSADEGDTDSQLKYGMMLLSGKWVEKSYESAVKYLKLAADGGLLEAKILYYEMARDGKGMEKNEEEYLQYLKMAANAGDLASQKEIARYYEEKDISKSITYYIKAAAKDDLEAIIKCAELSELKQNIKEAIQYYRIAIDKGDIPSMLKLANITTDPNESNELLVSSAEKGDPDAQAEYGKKLINIDIRKAFNLLYQSYTSENSEAALYIGILFYFGHEYIDIDKKSGIHYINMAVKMGNISALFQKGLIVAGYNIRIDNIKYPSVPKIKRSISIIEKAVDLNCIQAQTFYGMMLQIGDGIPQDNKKAFEYLQRAADNGDTYAQLQCGLMLFDGRGVTQDFKKAAQYFKMAANNNEPHAIVNYAFMLFDGQGTTKSKKESAKFMKVGADYKIKRAVYKYGTMLYKGQGVQIDLKSAITYLFKYLSEPDSGDPALTRTFEEIESQMQTNAIDLIHLAADSNYVEAQYYFGKILSKKDADRKDITKALKYFKKAADNNHVESQLIYASFTKDIKYIKMAADQNCPEGQYQYGLRLDTIDKLGDKSQALHYYKMAADNGVADAQINYADMLLHAEGFEERNYIDAAKYYRKAAAQGHKIGLIMYGLMLLGGKGVEQNFFFAAQMIQAAADAFDQTALYKYASMLEKGVGVRKNLTKAAVYYKKAAILYHDEMAQLKYAEMLEKGIGVPQNFDKAREFYRLASRNAKTYTIEKCQKRIKICSVVSSISCFLFVSCVGLILFRST